MENKSSQWSSILILLAIIVIVVLTVIGIWFLKSNSSNEGALRHVTYEVEADGGYAYIVYTTNTGENTEGQIYSTPFTKTIVFQKGQQVYLTASNPSQAGTITCSIKIERREWKTSSGTHPVDSVACGGIVK